MNCLDFHRQLLTDPFTNDAAVQAHEAECRSCANFARDVRGQEVRLRALLQDVSPPQGLAERVALAARFEQRTELRRGGWYAIAATVLLAIGVSMVSLWHTALERADISLAQSVLHHIGDEAHHLRESGPVSAGRVKWVFERFGATLSDDIGPVNFAAECLMRERTGVHLVLPGKRGPITVFFMPGEAAKGVLPVTSDRFAGQILPTSWGSIAIVGEAGEPLQGLGERLAALVDWPNGPALATGPGLATGILVAARRLPQQKNG